MRKPVFSSPIFDFLLVIKNLDHKLFNLKNKLWQTCSLPKNDSCIIYCGIFHIHIYGNVIKDISYLLPTC